MTAALQTGFYNFSRWLVRTVWNRAGTIEIHGLEHVPTTGPCIIVANHLSYLDPLLLQAYIPRVVHAMAKSTQFASPGMARFMSYIYSFPVRRYTPDPIAIRTVLRLLEADQAVMIYVEGERSWDGRLQPPRRGTVRLLLKAGVPVIPCRIDGTYDAWPRWGGLVRGANVHLTFKPPLDLPRLDRRADREAVLESTTGRLMAELSAPGDRWWTGGSGSG